MMMWMLHFRGQNSGVLFNLGQGTDYGSKGRFSFERGLPCTTLFLWKSLLFTLEEGNPKF